MKLKSLILLMSSILIAACGDKSENKKKSDNGLSLVQAQEKVLANQHNYTFSGQEDLNSYKCNEDFLVSSMKYIDLAQSYTKKVFKADKIPSAAQGVVDNHNILIYDMDAVMNIWDDSCEDKMTVASIRQARDYSSSLKITQFNSKSSVSLLNTLTLNDEYKNSLTRVIDAAKKGISPNFEDIITMHIHQQTLYSYERRVFQREVDSFRDELEALSNQVGVENIEELGAFKVAYEKQIMNNLGINEIKYNRAYFSVPSKVKRGKSQCLGGTKTDLLLNYLVRGEEFYNYRPVVIFSPGHILPGHIVGMNDEFHLYGTETTAAGEAQVYYGNIKNITSLSEDILIADAFDYLYINAIQSYLVNKIDVQKKVFKKFASQYEIANFNDHLNSILEEKNITMSNSLKGDIMAFGNSNVTAGDKTRSKYSTSNKSNSNYLSPNQLVSRIASKTDSNSSIIDRMRSRLSGIDYLTVPVRAEIDDYELEYQYTGPHYVPQVSNSLPLESIVSGNYKCTHNMDGEISNAQVRYGSIFFEGTDEKGEYVSMEILSTGPQATSNGTVYEMQGYVNQHNISFGVILYPTNNKSLFEMHTSFSMGAYMIPREQGDNSYHPQITCRLK